MAERSGLKKNLKYHRLIVLTIVITYIWVQYNYSTGNWKYDNGQAKIYGQKQNGKDEGEWTWYYDNGKKQMQGNFENGKRNGVWTVWDTSGNKISESYYVNDKLNGKYTRWNSSGIVESDGFYKDDILVSTQYYNLDNSTKK